MKRVRISKKREMLWATAAVLLSGVSGHCVTQPTEAAQGNFVRERYIGKRFALNQKDVRSIIETVRTQNGVPALSGAFISPFSVVDWSTGLRQVGQLSNASAQGVLSNDSFSVERLQNDNRVKRNDLFQVNSNLKAATATLAARLVDRGLIRFSSTPGQLFPDLAAGMNPVLRDVTLEQLLNHRAGIVALETLDELESFGGLRYTGTSRQQRRAFASDALKRAPATPIGVYTYSNGGYAVAGAMLEAAANQDFAVLMRRNVFGPLGATYNSGYPRDIDPNQPIGHLDALDELNFTPFDASPLAPPVLEPAGVANMTTRDFSLFVQMHLRGILGWNTLLRPRTMRRLHTPLPTGQVNQLGGEQLYAFGWEEATIDGVRTIVHYGGDDTYYSVAIIQPTRGVAAYVVTNAGGERAFKAINEAAAQLVGISNPASN